jgi:hypothetical protein
MLRSWVISICFGIASPGVFASDVPTIQKPERPARKAECISKGGKWILYPMGRFYFCAINTSDAGKVCSDDSQCQGDCEPVSNDSKSLGRCAPTLPMPGGCPRHMEKGKIISEPCI